MKSYTLIFRVTFSFFIAFLLAVLPLPVWLWWWRPVWVALVLIYWVMEFPRYVSFGTAWLVGITYDVLSDTVLGEHAVALLIVVAIIRSSMHILRTLSLFQQALCIMPVIFCYKLFIVLVQGMVGQLNEVGWFWLPALLSAGMWPWIYMLLSDYTRRLRRVR